MFHLRDVQIFGAQVWVIEAKCKSMVISSAEETLSAVELKKKMLFRKNIVVSFQSDVINPKDAQDCVHSGPLFDMV